MTTTRQAGPVPGLALRSARALLFGLVCVALAGVAHQVAGGCPGSVAARGLGLAGAFAVGLLLGRHERDLVTMIAWLAGTQLALHLLYVQLPDPTAAQGDVPGARGAALMLAAHVLALVLAGCWLRCGERALWALLRLLAARLGLLLHRVRPVLPGVVPSGAGPVPAGGPALEAGSSRPGVLPRRRGPPVRVCC